MPVRFYHEEHEDKNLKILKNKLKDLPQRAQRAQRKKEKRVKRLKLKEFMRGLKTAEWKRLQGSLIIPALLRRRIRLCFFWILWNLIPMQTTVSLVVVDT